MAGYDWKFALSLVASLALEGGAICILLLRCEAGQPSGPLLVVGIDGFLVKFLA